MSEMNITNENENENEERKLTFLEKKPRVCPVCEREFYHEMLLTGSGRLIAGRLRKDLRRMYEKSKKYGVVHPLIYVVVVCPDCLYASFSDDFYSIEESKKSSILTEKYMRTKYLQDFFGYNVDFTKPRDLTSGAASYFLAISGYYWHPADDAPTLKKAISSLRLSWLLEDLSSEKAGENYERLIPIFQYKASEYYSKAIEYVQNGKESFHKIKTYGPDIDNNFGYEGMLYMGALLGFSACKYIPDPNVRFATLNNAKRKISKVFGSGKSSKSKPSVLLEKMKELHKEINESLEELNKDYGISVE